MSLAKRFPVEVNREITKKETQWEECNLSAAEVRRIYNQSMAQHKKLFSACFETAKTLIEEQGAKPYQTSLVNVALALFNKHARHEHYMQEEFLQRKHKKVNNTKKE
jgi:hypothetical protein